MLELYEIGMSLRRIPFVPIQNINDMAKEILPKRKKLKPYNRKFEILPPKRHLQPFRLRSLSKTVEVLVKGQLTDSLEVKAKL